MSTQLRRLWWLDPAWPFALIVSSTILAAYYQSEHAFWLYKTPKYVEAKHVLLAAGVILSFVLGTRLTMSTGAAIKPTGKDQIKTICRWFWGLFALTLMGYFIWFLSGVKNGFSLSLAYELLVTDDPKLGDYIRDQYFATIPGVTTCTQFGVSAVLLGLWLYFQGYKRVFWPMILLGILGSFRAILFSERTAIIEMAVPGILLVMRMAVLGRSWPRWFNSTIRVLPILGPIVLLVFFGASEYFRSWRYYHSEFDSYTEFTVWRLSGYYTTAHNNGAMALETGVPRVLPFNTLRPLWYFPGVSQSPLGYKQVTGYDAEEEHKRMLNRYGNIELNNEGGMFQPTIDYGFAGGFIFWFAYGCLAGRLYRSFLAGSIGGLTVYPLIFLSILEVPLVLFLCYSRMLPPFLSLAAVAWVTRPRPETHLQPRSLAIIEAV